MGTAATEGEAVVSGKAGAEGDSEGDDVRNERGDAAVFNGERQYGEMDGGGNCADEEEESSLLGGVGRHGIRVCWWVFQGRMSGGTVCHSSCAAL